MHTVTSKDGTKITYDKSGQGPALILASGAFSYRKFRSLYNWRICFRPTSPFTTMIAEAGATAEIRSPMPLSGKSKIWKR